MGIRREFIVGDCDGRKICSLCDGVLVQPEEIVRCGHVFCANCFEDFCLYAMENSNCPVCSVRFESGIDTMPAVGSICQHLNAMSFQCGGKEQQCKQIRFYRDFLEHIQQSKMNVSHRRQFANAQWHNYQLPHVTDFFQTSIQTLHLTR